jgi:broad-specificity NMP kinase
MKKLIFIHGPNGTGKTTACRVLHDKLSHSALLESEWARKINPFHFTNEIELLTEANMTFLLKGYLNCSEVEYVIFNWGLHGRRKDILEKVLNNLSDTPHLFMPIILNCSQEENIRRLEKDKRRELQIERNNEIRRLYEHLPTYTIDTTDLTAEETVNEIIEYLDNFQIP